jgi:hypothetical protein
MAVLALQIYKLPIGLAASSWALGEGGEGWDGTASCWSLESKLASRPIESIREGSLARKGGEVKLVGGYCWFRLAQGAAAEAAKKKKKKKTSRWQLSMELIGGVNLFRVSISILHMIMMVVGF